MKVFIKLFPPKLEAELRIEKDNISQRIFVEDDPWRLEPLKRYFVENPAVAEFALQQVCLKNSIVDGQSSKP